MSELLRKELSFLIQRERDFESDFITISAIETTPDLKQAHVYVSFLEESARMETLLERLNKHRSEWQSVLGTKLKTRSTPRLVFHFDRALERGDRVMDIMRQIETDLPPEESPNP